MLSSIVIYIIVYIYVAVCVYFSRKRIVIEDWFFKFKKEILMMIWFKKSYLRLMHATKKLQLPKLKLNFYSASHGPLYPRQ